ncbi:hypothetical protein SAMN02799636_04951 [Methylobacterium sp. 275MFSha3.1]|uniref:hypothetical protein n=1 Tax=Methylobacterium sp. 275MFSha3.1 TaxID=1502746 RepID=UPI0008A72376|nr:hypothetical protein [Methylobacterium sp. 275MFSha3.1]SEI01611.1 hypothetical protein SAMN02799636_04951 [Methylobacterium sp. 275MFSha3.1]
MLPSVLFDASYFAMPGASEHVDDIEDIFMNINDWADRMTNQNVADFLIAYDVIDVLSAANCYPLVENVNALLELYELSHVFSANDISSRMLTIMSNAETVLESWGCETDEYQNCAIGGVDLSVCGDKILVENFERLCSTIAHSERSANTRILSSFPVNGEILRVSTTVEAVRQKDGATQVVLEPERMTVEIPHIDTPESFLRSLDPLQVWTDAETPEQIHLAVSLQVARDMDLNISSLPLEGESKFFVGSDFIWSLDRHGINDNQQNSAVVLRKCAECVTGAKGTFVRDFGEIRTRDKATSHRMHITKGGAAYRLMFWKKDGVPELANVGPKNELRILQGGTLHRAEF